ncbi:uncharacterized protein LOC143315854 isoform X1 [Chaetodon auriga]|uniref:uncharacterized protein LOC143315854 isoform X1 n=1 Tax=Chaetodon auriga TaxID=39042 RepID=UPI004032963E
MDLLWIWIVLPGFLVCAEPQNLTEVQVELGQHVLLNCSMMTPDIYWYMEIHGQIRGCIVRTFSFGSEYDYFISPHRDRFVVLKGNSLQIKNLTAEDCRSYFCGRKSEGSIILEEGFRLVSHVPVTPSTNVSEVNDQQQQQHICTICQSELVVYSSFALNVLLLLLALTGLAFTCLCLKKKNCTYLVTEAPPLTCENAELQETVQYEEIQAPTHRDPQCAAPPFECIYYKAQLPQPTWTVTGHLDGS